MLPDARRYTLSNIELPRLVTTVAWYPVSRILGWRT